MPGTNPTNYPIFQRTALKTNEPLNNPTNWPINPTNLPKIPTNPDFGKSIWKLHKRKKGRSREHLRSALKRWKAQKYWGFRGKRKVPWFYYNQSTFMTQKVVLRLTGEMIQCSGASAWISESLKDPAAILQASFSNANSMQTLVDRITANSQIIRL